MKAETVGKCHMFQTFKLRTVSWWAGPLLPRTGIKWGSRTPSRPCSWGPCSPGSLPSVLLTTAQPLRSDRVLPPVGIRDMGGRGWGAGAEMGSPSAGKAYKVLL